MTVPGRRQERVADQIRTEVAEIITLELKDPRIGFVTVTRVEVSPDFHAARVWVSVLGEEEIDDLLRARQAADVGRENAIGARLHRGSLYGLMRQRGKESTPRVQHLATPNRGGLASEISLALNK